MTWYFPFVLMAAILLPHMVGGVVAWVCKRYSWNNAAWEVEELALFVGRVAVIMVLFWGFVDALIWLSTEDFGRWQWPFTGEWGSSDGDDWDCAGGPRC